MRAAAPSGIKVYHIVENVIMDALATLCHAFMHSAVDSWRLRGARRDASAIVARTLNSIAPRQGYVPTPYDARCLIECCTEKGVPDVISSAHASWYHDDPEGKKTFSACIKEHQNYAEQDLAHVMYPPKDTGGARVADPNNKGGNGKGSRGAKCKAKKGAKGQKGAMGQQKGDGGGNQSIPTLKAWVNDKQIHVAKSKGGKKFCVAYEKGQCD